MKKFFILVISASGTLDGCVFPNFSKYPSSNQQLLLSGTNQL